jgi:hypothetical protein
VEIDMEEKKLTKILQEIQCDFEFLFIKGSKIHDVKKLSRGDWEIILSLGNLYIGIIQDQNEIGIFFRPLIQI